MDIWRVIADRKIREAMEDGAFDRLEGTGRPVDLEENPYLEPAQRMGFHILRNNGFAPAWIEEGKDLDVEIRRLEAGREGCEPGEFRRRVAEVNRKILAFNLKVPVPSAQRMLIQE